MFQCWSTTSRHHHLLYSRPVFLALGGGRNKLNMRVWLSNDQVISCNLHAHIISSSQCTQILHICLKLLKINPLLFSLFPPSRYIKEFGFFLLFSKDLHFTNCSLAAKKAYIIDFVFYKRCSIFYSSHSRLSQLSITVW